MSVVLNGSSQYLDTHTVPVTAVPFTISIWFKSDSNTASQALACLEQGTSYFHLLQAAGAIAGDPVRAMIYATTWSVATTTTGYTASTWTHALGIFTSTTSRTAYIDGGDSNENTDNKTAINMAYFMVGAYKQSAPTGYFDGLLAEVAVWNKALSSDNAVSLAGGANPLLTEYANLIAYWPLLNDALDDKGTNNLTLVGTPTYDADHPTIEPSYVDAAATITGVGSLTAAGEVMTYIDAIATITGAGSLTATPLVSVANRATVERLIAIGNNQVFYEDA